MAVDARLLGCSASGGKQFADYHQSEEDQERYAAAAHTPSGLALSAVWTRAAIGADRFSAFSTSRNRHGALRVAQGAQAVKDIYT